MQAAMHDGRTGTRSSEKFRKVQLTQLTCCSSGLVQLWTPEEQADKQQLPWPEPGGSTQFQYSSSRGGRMESQRKHQ